MNTAPTKNIILIGMPGSGKTTFGKRLQKYTRRPLLDIDTYIEQCTRRKVVDIIEQDGDEALLDIEEGLTKMIQVQGTIISCSGSVPLRQDAMNHLRRNGDSILLDTPLSVILTRLNSMKIGRIVGMNGPNPMTLEEILAYRKDFYDRSFDFRFDCPDKLSGQAIFREFIDFFESLPIESNWKQREGVIS